MKRQAKLLQQIRAKLCAREYEFAYPHFFIEMRNDRLIFPDVELAIANGYIARIFTDDPVQPRYEIRGCATDGREIAVICRINHRGKLVFITTWEVYE